MVYTPEEKQKIEELMQVFKEYIEHLPDYEILYSNKVGYLWLLTADNADYIYFPIENRDAFLRSLVENAILDEQIYCGTPIDYKKVRQFFFTLLGKLENDFEHCVEVLDDCLDRHMSFRKIFFGED